jgi:IS5 family transposase
VVALAGSLKVTRGRKLRVDSTVVETTIHHPTDSRLLGDGVRVLDPFRVPRLLRRAKTVVGEQAALGQETFRTRTRSVRRLAQQIHRVARRKGEAAAEELQRAYRQLIGIAQASRRQAQRVRAVLADREDAPARRLVEHLDHVLPLVDHAITQAIRRVLDGEVVPAGEKPLSLFEPHTRLITRHKSGKPVEFGCKLVLDEVDGGIVSRDDVVAEAGLDHPHLKESLAGHRARFGRAPDLLAGDRGLYSAANEELARQVGVERVVPPQAGRLSRQRQEYERQPWFRRGFRFRAGIEGRISVLKRGDELGRCRDHGAEGLGRWVGWGIVTANLATIARTIAARTT